MKRLSLGSSQYIMIDSEQAKVTGPGFSASLADLRAAHEGFFPKLMGSELTPEF